MPRRFVKRYQGLEESHLLHLQGRRVQEEGLNLKTKAAHFSEASIATYLPIDTAVIVTRCGYLDEGSL